MDEIKVAIPHSETSDSGGYSVYVGENSIDQLIPLLNSGRWSAVLAVVDDKLTTLWQNRIESKLGLPCFMFSVKSLEKEKTLLSAEKILQVCANNRLDRKSVIVNVGGGLVGDLGGFAASIYMRGIDFIQAPTTLLAQVDASVGGKVGVNFGEAKNLLGSFKQPFAVFADVSLLKSLPSREFLSGWAEIIKHALICDHTLFEQLESLDPSNICPSTMAAIVAKNVRIKASVVQKDPREMGIRKILNAGHTIGHAIEAASHTGLTSLLHGECVSIGLLEEAKIATELNSFSIDEYNRLEVLIKKFNLPHSIPQTICWRDVESSILLDKKNLKGVIKMALPSKIGECTPEITVGLDRVRQSFSPS